MGPAHAGCAARRGRHRGRGARAGLAQAVAPALEDRGRAGRAGVCRHAAGAVRPVAAGRAGARVDGARSLGHPAGQGRHRHAGNLLGRLAPRLPRPAHRGARRRRAPDLRSTGCAGPAVVAFAAAAADHIRLPACEPRRRAGPARCRGHPVSGRHQGGAERRQRRHLLRPVAVPGRHRFPRRRGALARRAARPAGGRAGQCPPAPAQRPDPPPAGRQRHLADAVQRRHQAARRFPPRPAGPSRRLAALARPGQLAGRFAATGDHAALPAGPGFGRRRHAHLRRLGGVLRRRAHPRPGPPDRPADRSADPARPGPDPRAQPAGAGLAPAQRQRRAHAAPRDAAMAAAVAGLAAGGTAAGARAGHAGGPHARGAGQPRRHPARLAQRHARLGGGYPRRAAPPAGQGRHARPRRCARHRHRPAAASRRARSAAQQAAHGPARRPGRQLAARRFALAPEQPGARAPQRARHAAPGVVRPRPAAGRPARPSPRPGRARRRKPVGQRRLLR